MSLSFLTADCKRAARWREKKNLKQGRACPSATRQLTRTVQRLLSARRQHGHLLVRGVTLRGAAAWLRLTPTARHVHIPPANSRVSCGSPPPGRLARLLKAKTSRCSLVSLSSSPSPLGVRSPGPSPGEREEVKTGCPWKVTRQPGVQSSPLSFPCNHSTHRCPGWVPTLCG